MSCVNPPRQTTPYPPTPCATINNQPRTHPASQSTKSTNVFFHHTEMLVEYRLIQLQMR